jgi:small-conductance mechanosensitive channel
MMDFILRLVPTVAVVILVAVVLFALQQIMRRRLSGSDQGFQRQLAMLLAGGTGLFGVLLVLPIGDTLRGQLLGLIGIVLSATIALSATTFLGNALAGIMLRVVQNFRIGDFIRVGDHFGRVSDRGLFHTEIQTENRRLVTLPNLYLITNPVTAILESGTVVNADVSLGYNVPRSEVEKLLLEAANRAKLEDPFVHITDLGSHSVTYRIAGILTDVKVLLTAQSNLKGCVMDQLHRGGVEIVSPTFMNTRALEPETMFIPVSEPPAPETPAEETPETKLFDKAEQAESLADMRKNFDKLSKDIEELKGQKKSAADETERESIESRIEELESVKENLENLIKQQEEEAKNPES